MTVFKQKCRDCHSPGFVVMFFLITVTGKEKFTDAKMLKLSKELSDEINIRQLATELKISKSVVDAALEDKGKKVLAANTILTNWKMSTDNEYVACATLAKALDKAGLKHLLVILKD